MAGATSVLPLLGRGTSLGPEQVRVGPWSAVPSQGTEGQRPTQQVSLQHPLLGRVATSHRQHGVGVPGRGRGTGRLARRGVWLTLRRRSGSGLKGGEEEVWVPLGLMYGSQFRTISPAKGSGLMVPPVSLQLISSSPLFSSFQQLAIEEAGFKSGKGGQCSTAGHPHPCGAHTAGLRKLQRDGVSLGVEWDTGKLTSERHTDRWADRHDRGCAHEQRRREPGRGRHGDSRGRAEGRGAEIRRGWRSGPAGGRVTRLLLPLRDRADPHSLAGLDVVTRF